jgi:glycosyltransferase involved in cell wall biosynthesis
MGGAELSIFLITSILAQHGFEVIVITGTKTPHRLPTVKYIHSQLLAQKRKFLLWANSLVVSHYSNSFREFLKWADIVYIPRFMFPIIPIAKALGKEVIVHLHDYIPISYIAAVFAPYEEHKHRITLDDIKTECMKSFMHCVGAGMLWWLPRLTRKWISQADKVICVSKRQAEIIANQVPELRDKIEVVYNSLPPEIINAEPRKELDETPTFLYVGGDSYVKGFHILLKAMKELGRQGIKARFILTNKYSRKSIKILNTLNNKYENLRIELVGMVEYHELLKLHEKAWALIFPSIWEEPLPYAVVEGMALGTIPIASKVGGIPELLDDTMLESFMFSPQNSSELIKIIKKLSTFDSNEVLSLSHKIRSIALKKFDANNISRKIVQIFSSY